MNRLQTAVRVRGANGSRGRIVAPVDYPKKGDTSASSEIAACAISRPDKPVSDENQHFQRIVPITSIRAARACGRPGVHQINRENSSKQGQTATNAGPTARTADRASTLPRTRAGALRALGCVCAGSGEGGGGGLVVEGKTESSRPPYVSKSRSEHGRREPSFFRGRLSYKGLAAAPGGRT